MVCSCCWVPRRRWTPFPVAGPPAGDGGFLPLPFQQGDGRFSFIEIDSLGVLGDGACGSFKVWSPLPEGEVDLDRCGGSSGGELEADEEEDEGLSCNFYFFEDQFAFGRMYCALDYV